MRVCFPVMLTMLLAVVRWCEISRLEREPLSLLPACTEVQLEANEWILELRDTARVKGKKRMRGKC